MHKRAETEARLVDAARKVIIESGFEGCTLERICSSAGFTRGAFYSNFSDKEALFTLLVTDEYSRIIERIDAVSRRWREDMLQKTSADEISFTDDEQQAQVARFLLRSREQVGMDRNFLILHNELLARAAREPEWAMQFMGINRDFVLGIGHLLEMMLSEVGRTITKRTETIAQAVIGIAMRYTGVSVWKEHLNEANPDYQRRGTMLELDDILELIVILLWACSKDNHTK